MNYTAEEIKLAISRSQGISARRGTIVPVHSLVRVQAVLIYEFAPLPRSSQRPPFLLIKQFIVWQPIVPRAS